jgi:hypothetical protein
MLFLPISSNGKNPMTIRILLLIAALLVMPESAAPTPAFAQSAQKTSRDKVTPAEFQGIQAYLRKLLNPKIRVEPRREFQSAEVYIEQEFIGVIFIVVDSDRSRSFTFEMAILPDDLKEN